MLYIELIPKTSFFKNLRSELPSSEWNKLRKATYEKAGHKCEICGGQGSRHPVECHEIWDYVGSKQILMGLIALCPKCHMVKHWGLTQMRGKENIAAAHLKKVNNWTNTQVRKHVEEAFGLWQQRNGIKWELDLTWLKTRCQNKTF